MTTKLNTKLPYELKGTILHTLLGHNSSVNDIAILPENGNIISGSSDGSVKIWDPNDGSLIRSIDYEKKYSETNKKGSKVNEKDIECVQIDAVAVLHNGYIAAGSSQNICVFDPDSWKMVMKIDNRGNKKLLVLKNGTLISGCYDSTIRMIDPYTGSLLKILSDHKSTVNCLIQLNNGDLVSGSADKTIKIWNSHEDHNDIVTSLTLLKNGELVSSGFDFKILIWTNDWTVKISIVDDTRITALTTLSNNDIASGGRDNNIKIWNVTDGALKKTLPTGATIYTLAHLQKSGFLVCGGMYENLGYKVVEHGAYNFQIWQ